MVGRWGQTRPGQRGVEVRAVVVEGGPSCKEAGAASLACLVEVDDQGEAGAAVAR